MGLSNKEELLKTLEEISLGISGALPTGKDKLTYWVYGKNKSATLGGFLSSKHGQDIAKSMKALIIPMLINYKVNAGDLAESAIQSVQSLNDARWLLENPWDFANKKGLSKAQPGVEDGGAKKDFVQYLEEKISAGVSGVASTYKTVKEVAVDSSKRVYLRFRIQEVEKKVEQVLNQEMMLHKALYDTQTRQRLYNHSVKMLLNAIFPKCGTKGIKEAQKREIYTVRMQYCQSLLSEAMKKLLSHYGIDAQQCISSRGHTNLEECISSMRTYKELSEFIFDFGNCTPALIGTEPIDKPSTTDSKERAMTSKGRIAAFSNCKEDIPLICYALLLTICFTAGCIAHAYLSPDKHGLYFAVILAVCIICAVATAICFTILTVNALRTSRVGVTHESSTSEEQQGSVANSCKSLKDLSLQDHQNKNERQ